MEIRSVKINLSSFALEWLNAELMRYQAQESRISGDAELLKDFASLHKALGLGRTLGAVNWVNPGIL